MRIPIEGPEMLMEEALICLRERAGGKLVSAFLEISRTMAEAETTASARKPESVFGKHDAADSKC